MNDRPIAALLGECTWVRPPPLPVFIPQPIQGLKGVRQSILQRKTDRRLRASFTLTLAQPKQTIDKPIRSPRIRREPHIRASPQTRTVSAMPQAAIIYSPRPAPERATVRLWRQDLPLFPSYASFSRYYLSACRVCRIPAVFL